jgi:hypothetical protein
LQLPLLSGTTTTANLMISRAAAVVRPRLGRTVTLLVNLRVEGGKRQAGSDLEGPTLGKKMIPASEKKVNLFRLMTSLGAMLAVIGMVDIFSDGAIFIPVVFFVVGVILLVAAQIWRRRRSENAI